MREKVFLRLLLFPTKNVFDSSYEFTQTKVWGDLNLWWSVPHHVDVTQPHHWIFFCSIAHVMYQMFKHTYSNRHQNFNGSVKPEFPGNLQTFGRWICPPQLHWASTDLTALHQLPKKPILQTHDFCSKKTGQVLTGQPEKNIPEPKETHHFGHHVMT